MENQGGDRMNITAVLDKTTQAQWEIYIQHSTRTDVQLRGSKREALIRQENTGYGVRVILPRSGGAGVGYSSCNSDKDLEATARRAHDLAKLNRSPFFELPAKRKLLQTKTADRRILTDSERVAKDYADEAQALISEEKDISLTYGKVRTYVVENQIINSRGLACKSVGTYLYVEMTLKIGSGTSATEFWPSRYSRRVSDLEPTNIILEWLKIARSCLKRHPPRTKQTTIILSPAVVCDIFVPTIGFHSSAEALNLNLSAFKEHQHVASEELTIVDDGLYPYGLRTNSFDDEGQPQEKTRLIEKGVFKNYLYDQLHAQTMDAKPTGNGIRTGFGIDVDERYQTIPANDNTNLTFSGGDQSLEELIQDTKDGLMIYQAAWLNPDRITTRFGSEIRNAQEIKNGELVEGVVGGSLSGSAFELMKGISGISDRPEVVSGYAFGCVAPYIRLEGVQISGSS